MNLEHLFLQNEKITIQKDAFKNCTNLKQITLNGNTYFLTGLPNQIKNRQMPELVHTIHTQLLENFCISGTVLLRYWSQFSATAKYRIRKSNNACWNLGTQ